MSDPILELIEDVTYLEIIEDGTVLEVIEQTVEILEMGIPGPAGVDGTGDLNYTHTQVGAASAWIIVHSLGKQPSVTIVDSGGTTVFGDVLYDSLNQLTINFTTAFSGYAYLN